MINTRIHPDTGKVLRRDVRETIVEYKGLSEKVVIPGWYPDDDSDSIHTGTDLKESDKVYRRLKKIHPQE